MPRARNVGGGNVGKAASILSSEHSSFARDFPAPKNRFFFLRLAGHERAPFGRLRAGSESNRVSGTPVKLVTAFLSGFRGFAAKMAKTLAAVPF
jgi:hypothetical protein